MVLTTQTAAGTTETESAGTTESESAGTTEALPLPELSMTKPLSVQLIANFEPSPLHSIILQSANFSLRRKVFIHQVYWGRDTYIYIYKY